MLPLLFLEWLCCVLLVAFDSLSQGSGVLGFPWETLLCVALIVFLIMKRYTLKRERGLARNHSDKNIVHEVRKKTAPTLQTAEALETSVVMASVPRLKTLCLAALKKNLNIPSLDREEFLKTVQKSVPPRPSGHELKMTHLQQCKRSPAETFASHQAQVTDAEQITKISATTQQLEKKLTDILSKNIHLQRKTELLFRDYKEWKQRTQVLTETRDSLEHSHAQVQERNEKESHLNGQAETMQKAIQVPQLLTQGCGEAGPLASEEKSNVRNGRHPGSSSEVDLKSLSLATDLRVSEIEKELAYRKLYEANQINSMLIRQRDHLQRENASLRSQESQLKSENQELHLKLQVLSELHGERMKQLLRKSAEEQARSLEIEERLNKRYENLNNIQQRCSFYKKRVRDMEEELERTTMSFQNDILFYETRAQESCMATLLAQRQMEALRKENNYITQKLAKIQVKAKLIKRVRFADGGPEVWEIPSHQVFGKEKGNTGRSQGSLRVPCSFK